MDLIVSDLIGLSNEVTGHDHVWLLVKERWKMILLIFGSNSKKVTFSLQGTFPLKVNISFESGRANGQ